jgi:hypothetical protein
MRMMKGLKKKLNVSSPFFDPLNSGTLETEPQGSVGLVEIPALWR